jgi:hypothetical protein
MSNITYSIQNIFGHVYAWSDGNPSGCPITSELNSLYNVTVSKLAYEKTTGKMSTPDNFRVMTYGDDKIGSVRPDSGFDIDKYSSFLRKLGMRPTNARKTGDPKLSTFDELIFLKRKFVLDEYDQFICPIDADVIHDLVHYTKTLEPSELHQRILESITEASFHEKKFFNEWRDTLVHALKTEKVVFNSMSQGVRESLFQTQSNFRALAKERGSEHN